MKQIRRWIALFTLGLSVALPAPIPAQKTAPASVSARAFSKKEGNKYPTVDMRGGKRGEEKTGEVIYLNSTQREERRIAIEKGLVYDHTGKPVPDTRSSHKNQNNYVMDAAGNFYLFDEFTVHSIRHSSIFAGGPVAGAGNLVIKQGRIVYIDSSSGHYPSKPLFANVLKELSACGVDTAGISK